MQPVLAGKVPLMVAVDRAVDIQSALDLARDYKLRLMSRAGPRRGAWRRRWPPRRCRSSSSAEDNIPQSFDTLGARQENAALLRTANVPVVLTAGAVVTFNVRDLKQHAGNAVAYGLPWDEALRAVTPPRRSVRRRRHDRLARARQGRQRRRLERGSVRVHDPRRTRLRPRHRGECPVTAGPVDRSQVHRQTLTHAPGR